jgi:hypothetical protein
MCGFCVRSSLVIAQKRDDALPLIAIGSGAFVHRSRQRGIASLFKTNMGHSARWGENEVRHISSNLHESNEIRLRAGRSMAFWVKLADFWRAS